VSILIEQKEASPFILIKIDDVDYPLLVTDNHLTGKTGSFPRLNNPAQKLNNFSANIKGQAYAAENQLSVVQQNATASLSQLGDNSLDLPQGVGEKFLAANMTGLAIGSAAGTASLGLTAWGLHDLESSFLYLFETAKELADSENLLEIALTILDGADNAVKLTEDVEDVLSNPFLDFVGRQSPLVLGMVALGVVQGVQYIKEQKKNKKYNPFVQIAEEAKRLSKDKKLSDNQRLEQLKTFTNTVQSNYTQKQNNLMGAFSVEGKDVGVKQLAEDYKHLSMGKFSTKTSKKANVKTALVVRDENNAEYIYIETKGGGHFLTSAEDFKNGKLFNVQEKEKSATRTIKSRRRIALVQGIVFGSVMGATHIISKLAGTEIIDPSLEMIDTIARDPQMFGSFIKDLGVLGDVAIGMLKDTVRDVALDKVAAAMPSPVNTAIAVGIFQARRHIVKGAIGLYRTVKNPRRLLTWSAEKKKDLNRARSEGFVDKAMHMLFPVRARKEYRKNALALIQRAQTGAIQSGDYQDFTEATFAKTKDLTRFQRVVKYIKDARRLLMSEKPEVQAEHINQARLVELVTKSDLQGDNAGQVLELIPELLKMGVPPEVLEEKIAGAQDLASFKAAVSSKPVLSK